MRVKIYNTSNNPLPEYQTPGAAGMDIRADLNPMSEVCIRAHETKNIPTGIFLEIPEGYECQVRSRSGLSSRGLIVANAPGTIDSDYRGETRILVLNTTNEDQYIENGDRIAQMVFAPVLRIQFENVQGPQDFSPTKRGTGGCGSTGTG